MSGRPRSFSSTADPTRGCAARANEPTDTRLRCARKRADRHAAALRAQTSRPTRGGKARPRRGRRAHGGEGAVNEQKEFGCDRFLGLLKDPARRLLHDNGRAPRGLDDGPARLPDH